MGRTTVREGPAQTNGHANSKATPKRPTIAEPNVHNAVLGNLLIKAWYPSFYPEELVGPRSDRLYVCQWCFRYSKELMPFLRHVKVCPLKDAQTPGKLIYAKGGYSIYEVDGEEHKLYTQNLSLFAKLFLDTKSVFYDVTTFLYYLLVADNPNPAPSVGGATRHPQVVGFFSKEKMSWDNNNLACILVFPPWQRQGLGQILMGVSYELSKREARLGGPEKPLSDLGHQSYVHYWSHTLARFLLAHPMHTKPSMPPLTVREISRETYIVPEDIIATLEHMGVVDKGQPPRLGGKKRKAEAEEDGIEEISEAVLINKTKLRMWAERNRLSLELPVDLEGFVEEAEVEAEEEEEEGEEEES